MRLIRVLSIFTLVDISSSSSVLFVVQVGDHRFACSDVAVMSSCSELLWETSSGIGQTKCFHTGCKGLTRPVMSQPCFYLQEREGQRTLGKHQEVKDVFEHQIQGDARLSSCVL